MIRMAEEEEQEGKNLPPVLLVEAISADDKDDASMMQMMMTTNVCAYISYSYAKVINFAARAVQTWDPPLDDDASMIEGKSKDDDEVPMTERQKARGKACLGGGLISVVVIALCGLVVYRGGGGGRTGTDGRMYYYGGSSSYESEVSSGASGGWLEQARAFLSNATGVEARLGTTDNEHMFPTILEEIHEDASACDARIRAAQVPYFYNRHCAYLGR